MSLSQPFPSDSYCSGFPSPVPAEAKSEMQTEATESTPTPEPLLLRHSAFLTATSAQPPDPEAEPREPVRILVVGSAQGIDTIVQTLHLRGFAYINQWSRLMPHSTGKLMRVLTRWVQGAA